MRLRRTVWRIAGPTAGRLAPRPARAFYNAVTESLAQALEREPEVLAVYAYGSYATGALRPGESDVDLVVVVEDVAPDQETELLRRLRRIFRRRQAILPVGLSVLQRSEFERGAAWLAWSRTRIGNGLPMLPVSGWLRLAGEEVRSREGWEPEGRLWYVTEAHVAEALALGRRSPAAARARIAALALDLEREGLAVGDLRARDPVRCIHAALGVIDEQRARNALAAEAIGAAKGQGWRVEEPGSEIVRGAALAAGRAPARSGTLVVPPFERSPLLLLEARDVAEAEELIRWALSPAADGLPVHVTTSLLAVDAARSGFRSIAIAAGAHLTGEPLAPRLRFPNWGTSSLLLESRAWAAVGDLRRFALGLRFLDRDDSWLLRLALIRRLLRSEDPVTRPDELLPGASSLDDEAWLRLGLGLWSEVRSLIGKQNAFVPQPVAVD